MYKGSWGIWTTYNIRESTLDLRDYLRILRQRWMVIVLVTVSISGTALFFASQEPTRYTAKAEIILRDNPYRFFRSGEYPSFFPDHFSRSTRAQLIRSRDVLDYAITNGLSELYPTAQLTSETELDSQIARENAILELRNGLTITQADDSELITITYQDVTESRAIQIVNEIAKAFQTVSKTRQEKGIDDAIHFISRTTTERSKETIIVRKELNSVIVKKKALESTQDHKMYQGVSEDLASLRESSREMRLSRNRLKIEIRTLEALLGGKRSIPLDEDNYSLSNQISTELETKQIELILLERKYTNNWPQIGKIKNEITFLQKRLILVREQEQTSARLSMADRLSKLKLEESEIGNQLQKNKDEVNEKVSSKDELDMGIIANLIKIENQKQEMETRLKALDESIRSLDEYKQKLQINSKMIVEAVYRLDKAKHGLPLTKQGFRSFPLILLTALIVGVAFAYLLEYLNTSIRTEHDVKRYINLPLFGMVMKIKEEKERLLLHAPPKSPVSELFNTIAAMIEAQYREKGSKTFMVASPNAAEGKSTITTNIAIALARGGARVILIDADLRRAVLHKFFNLDNKTGLATYLAKNSSEPSDISSLVHKTEIDNLSVIPAGPHPANPVLLLKSGSFISLLDHLKEKADYILVDVPPVRIAVDTILLAPQIQNTILLTSAGETNKEDVAFAKNLIESAKGNLVGCILNKAMARGEGYYYYYDYYRYYGRH